MKYGKQLTPDILKSNFKEFESPEEIEKGRGKAWPIGTIKKFGGREMVKTSNGWIPTKPNKKKREEESSKREIHSHKADPKDLKRIKDLSERAKGDTQKEVQLAKNMANAIKDPEKAGRRGAAAAEIYGTHHPITQTFLDRRDELNGGTKKEEPAKEEKPKEKSQSEKASETYSKDIQEGYLSIINKVDKAAKPISFEEVDNKKPLDLSDLSTMNEINFINALPKINIGDNASPREKLINWSPSIEHNLKEAEKEANPLGITFIVTHKDKEYLVDTQGYDYPRYIAPLIGDTSDAEEKIIAKKEEPKVEKKSDPEKEKKIKELEETLSNLKGAHKKWSSKRANSMHPFDPQKKMKDYVSYLERNIKNVESKLKELNKEVSQKEPKEEKRSSFSTPASQRPKGGY